MDGFFSTVSAILSDPLHAFRLADLRAELKQIVVNADSYINGIHEIKRVIMKMIPYSLRCTEVLYEPKIIGCRTTKKSTVNVLEEDYVFFVRLTGSDNSLLARHNVFHISMFFLICRYDYKFYTRS